MMYLGIDPGVSGGLAVIVDGGHVYQTTKMPATERDLLDWLRTWVVDAQGVEGRAVALIERVSASPQMGVVSAFSFGRGYGGLLMALTALEIPFDWIQPAKWQTFLSCRSGGDKNVTKRRAQQLFPHLTVTHAIADAALLAEYCRRIHRPTEVQTDGKEERKGHTPQEHTEGVRQGKGSGKAWNPRRGVVESGVDVGKGKDRTETRTAVAGAPGPRAGKKQTARERV